MGIILSNGEWRDNSCVDTAMEGRRVKRAPKPVPKSTTDRRSLAAFISRDLPYIPHPGQHLLMHLRSQSTIDIHYIALSSLPRPLWGRGPARSMTEPMRNHYESKQETRRYCGLREPTQLTAPVKRASQDCQLKVRGCQLGKCRRINRKLLFTAGVSPGNWPYPFQAGYLATPGRRSCAQGQTSRSQ